MDWGLILVLVGTLSAIGLCWLLWRFCDNKFNSKFGEGEFTNFGVGLFWVLLGGFFLFGELIYGQQNLECSHQTGTCTKTVQTVFQHVIEKQEFGISQITGVSIDVHTSGSGSRRHTSYELEAMVNGKKIEIPEDGSKRLEQQKQAFEKFLKNKNAPDYVVTESHVDRIWGGLGAIVVGLLFVGSSVKNKVKSSSVSATPTPNVVVGEAAAKVAEKSYYSTLAVPTKSQLHFSVGKGVWSLMLLFLSIAVLLAWYWSQHH